MRRGLCHICERPFDHDWDPYYAETDPGHYDDEEHFVAIRNGLYVAACHSCWFKWPDPYKREVAEAERMAEEAARLYESGLRFERSVDDQGRDCVRLVFEETPA